MSRRRREALCHIRLIPHAPPPHQFLAIILESYTEVRSRSHGSPSLLDDARAFVSILPPARTWHRVLFCGLCGRTPGLDVVVRVLTTGPLRNERVISPVQLRTHCSHLTASGAEALVTDALAWSFSAAAAAAAVAPLPGLDEQVDDEAAPRSDAAAAAAAAVGRHAGGTRPASYSAVRAAITRASGSGSFSGAPNFATPSKGEGVDFATSLVSGISGVPGAFTLAAPATSGGGDGDDDLASALAQLDMLGAAASRLAARIATLRQGAVGK